MMAQANDLDLAIAELDTAESFLNFFNIKFDPEYLISRRIKFMRLFQRQLSKIEKPYSWDDYQKSVFRAYCELEQDIGIAFSESHCASCQSDCSSKGEGSC